MFHFWLTRPKPTAGTPKAGFQRARTTILTIAFNFGLETQSYLFGCYPTFLFEGIRQSVTPPVQCYPGRLVSHVSTSLPPSSAFLARNVPLSRNRR